MSYEEVRDLLKSIKRNRSLLRTIERKLTEDDRFIFISAIDYSRPSVKGRMGKPKQEEYCEFKERLERKHKALCEQAEKLTLEIFIAEDTINNAIAILTPLEQDIIISSYMNGQGDSTIARQKNYSLSHIKRLKNKAVKKMSNFLNVIPNDTLFSEN